MYSYTGQSKKHNSLLYSCVDNHGWAFEKEDWGKGKEDEEKVGSEIGELNKTASGGHIRSPNIQFQIECVLVHV